MGEKYILCILSQSYLADEHCPTLSFTESGNPSKIKSNIILVFLSNSFVDAFFGFFVALYHVTTKCQTSYPCACKNVFILLLHISYFRPFRPSNNCIPFLHKLLLSMILLPVVKLFSLRTYSDTYCWINERGGGKVNQ